MAHARADLRAAVIARVTGLSTAGARVYPSLAQARSAGALPFTAVWIPSEIVSPGHKGTASGGPIQQRDASVTIAVFAETLTEIEVAAEEIEIAMATPDMGRSHFLELTEIEDSEGADKLRFGVRLTYRVVYGTAQQAPGTSLDSF